MLNIRIPEKLVLSTRQTNQEFQNEAKKAIALKFYNDERLSLGQASELADMSKFEFMKYLSKNGISVFRYESDDLEEELQKDVDNAGRFTYE